MLTPLLKGVKKGLNFPIEDFFDLPPVSTTTVRVYMYIKNISNVDKKEGCDINLCDASSKATAL
jgi:hypothetical protein